MTALIRRLLHRSSSLLLWSIVLAPAWSQSAATRMVETPVLSTYMGNDQGAFAVILMSWDRETAPNPAVLRWGNQRLHPGGAAQDSVADAFAYALSQQATPPSGTISLFAASYAPVGVEGPSAGAVMAVGFMALLRGDPLLRDVALTGTLQAQGRIGPVGGIPDKLRAAKREGYHLVLIPVGQLETGSWHLPALAAQLGIAVREVETIADAYSLMTGKHP